MIKLTLLERRLRISTGLILASYILLHLSNHILGLISLELMESVREGLTSFWRSWVGGFLIYGSILTHFTLALISLYRRTTLVMPPWEMIQLLLGLSIIPLLAGHVAATLGSRVLMDLEVDYEFIISGFLSNQWLTIRQLLLLLVAWSHACMGLHFCFRLSAWYRAHLIYFYPLVLLVPLLVVLSVSRIGVDLDIPDFSGVNTGDTYSSDSSGYDSSGYEYSDDEYGGVGSDASKSRYEDIYGYGESPSDSGTITLGFDGEDLKHSILATYWGLLVTVLILRWGRNRQQNGVAVKVQHVSGCVAEGREGQSILEILRQHRIPHASVCGGRGRCTTCRVRVDSGIENLSQASSLERHALERIGAAPNVRLACQSRPNGSVKITPLLPHDIVAGSKAHQGGVNGDERSVLAMFVDLRDSTRLGERRLPYDVLFVLNRFFLEMSEALKVSHGHYAQFAGDGLMALYGLDRGVKQGSIDALRGAVDMQRRIDSLNKQLADELEEPLKIGIGIHCGEAIVGTMGPPASPNYSAIGDNINAAARLESQTKHLGCILVVSEQVADATGLDFGRFDRHQLSLKGKEQQVVVYAVNDLNKLVRMLKNDQPPQNAATD